ncbi:MAG: hypothetical protein NTV49_10755 [Kiritimatiellaeota bacterium]|nr:hypothetical protein [Kiritimatiellota bacterium]
MKEMSDIGAERRQQGHGQTIIRTAAAVLCFYVFAGLLNGEALRHDVELMPYGGRRDVCVALVKPMAWLSRVTYLGSFRSWIEKSVRKADMAAPNP